MRSAAHSKKLTFVFVFSVVCAVFLVSLGANAENPTIIFDKTLYSRYCDVVRITVEDQEKNVRQNETDTVDARVWSTTDKGGILLTLRETYEDSGIFSEITPFIDATSSAFGLRAEVGDSIFAKYDNLTATAKIYPSLLEPVQRILVSDASITSPDYEKLLAIDANFPKIILSKIESNQSREVQPFFNIIRIKDADGYTVFLSFMKGALQPCQSMELGTQWLPSFASNYEIEIFVWDSLIDPEPLSEVTKTQIELR